MQAGNHVAGGIVFTGLFASFFDANIFSSIDLLVWTGFASLIPDIDHTKSVIGKIFYPISKWIDRRYGHRTITHSLLFLAVISIISATIENIVSDNYNYSIILFFAVFSHFVLDMITVQGIPFFYPFAKNPCVIPENPRYRIRTNNKRAEVAVFCISILLMFSCANLFKNGFWTSYNRAFGTLKHVHAENRNSTKLIRVDYNYTKNNKSFKGSGYLLNSKENEAIIFDKKVFKLTKNDNSLKVNSVKPIKTIYDKETNEIGFYGVDYDSLQTIVNSKVVSGQIQSSQPVEIVENNIRKHTSLIKIEYVYNLSLNVFEDTTVQEIRNKIQKLEIQLEQQKIKYEDKKHEITKLFNKYKRLEQLTDNTADIYEKNKQQKEMIAIRAEIEQKEKALGVYKPDAIKLYEIKLLKEELDKDNLRFSGILNYPILPKELLAIK